MRFVRYKKNHDIKVGYVYKGQILDLFLSLQELGLDEEYIRKYKNNRIEKLALNKGFSRDFKSLIDKSDVILTIPGIISNEEEIEMLSPIANPGKIICVGLNYPQNKKNILQDFPEYPILFHKVSSALTGHKKTIILPKISKAVHYEGELAIIIGRRAKQISPESALDFVAGLSIANDVGAMDIQDRSSQWTSGKMFDTFCPLGPVLVTLDEILDLDNLRISTKLNGELVQDGSTGDMIFGVRDLVSYISELTTLEPGDIILTGSPKLVGDQPDPQTLLKSGDVISIEIENIGILSNSVISEV